MSSDFTYSKRKFNLTTLIYPLKNQNLRLMILNYKPGDFSDFTDKVSFDVKIKPSKIATNDIRHFMMN
jgi:hypothetical protein